MVESKNIIEVKNLTFTYPNSDKPIIKDMNFVIREHSWTAIIGHNGSGKSTLTRLLDGLISPDNTTPTASIIINGVPLTSDNVWQIRKDIGVVFQNPDNQFVGATVADDVAFGLENREVPREQMLSIVDEALINVNMENFKQMEPENLSGGQKQRVAIAGIIAVKPKIIILDEATSMLDPEGKKDILNLIRSIWKKEKLTIISITHNIDEAEMADQVIVMNDGSIIAQDTPINIFKQTFLIEKSGLDIPFAYKLRDNLISDGIKLSNKLDNKKELKEVLWQLNSRM